MITIDNNKEKKIKSIAIEFCIVTKNSIFMLNCLKTTLLFLLGIAYIIINFINFVIQSINQFEKKNTKLAVQYFHFSSDDVCTCRPMYIACIY